MGLSLKIWGLDRPKILKIMGLSLKIWGLDRPKILKIMGPSLKIWGLDSFQKDKKEGIHHLKPWDWTALQKKIQKNKKNTWRHMKTHEDPWRPMNTHEAPWSPMKPHEDPWRHMKTHENPWKAKEKCEKAFFPSGFCELKTPKKNWKPSNGQDLCSA